jgi:hypothetical protein
MQAADIETAAEFSDATAMCAAGHANPSCSRISNHTLTPLLYSLASITPDYSHFFRMSL